MAEAAELCLEVGGSRDRQRFALELKAWNASAAAAGRNSV